MSFASPIPVINTFSEVYQGRFVKANWLWTGEDGERVADSFSVFSWSVANATRYELYGPSGLMYSGTANSYVIPSGTRIGNIADTWTFTLRAWNGSNYVDRNVTVVNGFGDPNCDANCSGS